MATEMMVTVMTVIAITRMKMMVMSKIAVEQMATGVDPDKLEMIP